MSAQGLQHVVCRGAIDRSFFTELARSPIHALAGFDLNDDERALIIGLAPRDLAELTLGVEAWRRGASLEVGVPARSPARIKSLV